MVGPSYRTSSCKILMARCAEQLTDSVFRALPFLAAGNATDFAHVAGGIEAESIRMLDDGIPDTRLLQGTDYLASLKRQALSNRSIGNSWYKWISHRQADFESEQVDGRSAGAAQAKSDTPASISNQEPAASIYDMQAINDVTVFELRFEGCRSLLSDAVTGSRVHYQGLVVNYGPEPREVTFRDLSQLTRKRSI